MSRDKENQAKIELLAELLAAEGVISDAEADAIIDGRDFRELHGVAQRSRGGRPDLSQIGPPGNSNGKGPNNG